MPRKCQVNGCEERGTQFEGWKVRFIDPLVIVWLCEEHHQASLAQFHEPAGAHRDGPVQERTDDA